jgi:anaerobic ribonucleoside-triphosphate reductase
MKVTIDISDFYLDEGEELESSLKQFIIRECVQQINKSIEKKVEDHITRTVKNEIEQKLTYKINKQIEEIIATETIKVDGKEQPFNEYIKYKFQYSSGWSSAQGALESLAKRFGEELKKRYDMLFASQIVSKLHENGMLKEDVAKLLLPKEAKE